MSNLDIEAWGTAVVPNQNHFLLELAAAVKLGADFIVEIEKLLERLVLGRHNEANDMH